MATRSTCKRPLFDDNDVPFARENEQDLNVITVESGPDRNQLNPPRHRSVCAGERKDLPVQDVACAGGWKTVETVQRLYQQPDGATTLAAVEGGK